MHRGHLPEAPNYTTAALVMGAINLFWILGVIWAVFGWPMVMATGFTLDRLICWWGHR